jgi:DNA-binding beta-propeller fold protein YncE
VATRSSVIRFNATTGTALGPPIAVTAKDEPNVSVAAMAVAGGQLLVAKENQLTTSDNTVIRIDATTGTVLGPPSPVAGNPIVLTVDRGVAWVANLNETLSRVDVQTGRVLNP